MSYTKPCNKCGQRISIRQMPAGQWVAFDVSTEETHVCGIKNQPDISVKLKSKKKTKIEDNTEDFGIKVDDIKDEPLDDIDDEIEKNKFYDSALGIENCIYEAIKKRKRVYIEYNSEFNQEFTEREISPVKKFKENGRSYVQAYCHKRKAERIFLINSISSASDVNKPRTKVKLGKPNKKRIYNVETTKELNKINVQKKYSKDKVEKFYNKKDNNGAGNPWGLVIGIIVISAIIRAFMD
jgi:hypothetical protein